MSFDFSTSFMMFVFFVFFLLKSYEWNYFWGKEQLIRFINFNNLNESQLMHHPVSSYESISCPVIPSTSFVDLVFLLFHIFTEIVPFYHFLIFIVFLLLLYYTTLLIVCLFSDYYGFFYREVSRGFRLHLSDKMSSQLFKGPRSILKIIAVV